MEVKVARTAGFCFGVERAVRQVEELIQSGAKPLYTYGPIIHNEQVVEEFESRGVKALEDEEAVKQAEPGTIVLRSHGVSRREEEEIKNLGFHVVDATCPFVKKIHHLVAGAREEGRKVLIAGDVTHPEVQAIVGWCGEPPYVMASQEEIPSLPEDTPLLLVAQTTFHQEKFEKIVEIIKKKYYNASVVNTICNATQRRQQEAAELALHSDAMIVIGGKQSSNTKKLVEVCGAHCAKTYYIQSARDLTQQGFLPVRVVGITAGASTPKNTIEEVQNFVRGEF